MSNINNKRNYKKLHYHPLILPPCKPPKCPKLEQQREPHIPGADFNAAKQCDNRHPRTARRLSFQSIPACALLYICMELTVLCQAI